MEIRVRFYERKRGSSSFSLERVFGAVQKALPRGIIAEVFHCPFQSRGFIRRALNVLASAVHQGDLNHIVGDVHYVALGLKRHKTILTIHDCGGLRLKEGLQRLILLWFWYRLPVRCVAAVTVISDFTRDEVVHYTNCNREIIHVIPDPTPNEFVPWPKAFQKEVPVILQVGTKEHNKNICRVAEALSGIPCRLDIIGRLTKRQRDALEGSRISFMEHSNLSDRQVVEKYRECDLVVFVSTYEGFGMPIAEANATGRPVVTSNIPPMTSVAGSAACLVDPFDSTSIREGVLRVIGDAEYRNDLVARGFENAKRFDAETIAAEYAALYKRVMSGGSR